MGRPRREQYPGAFYHVMARGNNHQTVFLDDRDRRDFIWILTRACEQYRLKVHAFCLMTNHYHLFLRTTDPNLSDAMHWLSTMYVHRFNSHHERDGHLFRNRYLSVPVEKNSHWLYLSAYIHLNPVRAGLAVDPGDWEWSSFRDYIEPRSRYRWLDTGPVLATQGAIDSERRRNYRQAITKMADLSPSQWEEWRETFSIAPRLEQTPAAQLPSMRLTTFDLEAEIRKFAIVLGTTPERFLVRSRDFSRPVLFHHLVRECGFSSTQVAEYFHVTPTSICSGIRRYEDKKAGARLEHNEHKD